MKRLNMKRLRYRRRRLWRKLLPVRWGIIFIGRQIFASPLTFLSSLLIGYGAAGWFGLHADQAWSMFGFIGMGGIASYYAWAAIKWLIAMWKEEEDEQ